MSRTILQPCVGYGFDPTSGDHRLNTDEEQFARRVIRSPWWREQMRRAAGLLDDQRQGPPSWTFTAPVALAGAIISDPQEVNRLCAAHGSAVAGFNSQYP